MTSTPYALRIRDLPDSERPRTRLLNQGATALSNGELLSLIIGSGTAQENALCLCQRLLSGMDLSQLSTTTPAQLMEISGIKEAKAAQILACFELARRLESFRRDELPKINSPEDIYRMLYPQMREAKKESFVLFCLDTKNQVIKQEVVSVGSLNANIVHPREVFRAALMAAAAHIIVAHNHPSGDPTPSREDIEITKKLAETGNIVGINLLDHVIIGDGRHFSMKETGHI